MNRQAKNPILVPSKDRWDSFAVFNPSVIEVNGEWKMLYRAIGEETEVEGHRLRLSSLGIASSSDGIEFRERTLLLAPETHFDLFGCEDPRVTFFEGRYYVFYTALSGFPFSADNIRVGLAVSSDLRRIDARHLVTPFNGKAMTLFPERVNGKVTAILSVNTDRPPATMAVVQCESVDELCDPHFWYRWYGRLGENAISLGRLNTDQVEVGATPIRVDDGWLLVYSHIQNYTLDIKRRIFGIEAAVLAAEDPRRIVARTATPFLTPEAAYEREGTVPNITFPTSAAITSTDELRIYYGAADTNVALASEPWSRFKARMIPGLREVPKAQKLHYPILAPRPHMNWERNGVFNPAVWDDGEKLHILYRAQSDAWTSTLGYACLSNPYCVEYRSHEPAYWPRKDFEIKKLKEGYSGCEDPRLTQIGDKLYMTYTAYDGVNPPRVALTSIPVKEFQARNWLAWKEPRLISRPGLMDKNACIFPEKVNGKYILLHRVDPDMLIDRLDDLEFSQHDSDFLDDHVKIVSPRLGWDSLKLGAGAPPIKTAEGWLLIYHGVDRRDRQYRAGALLLDLNDPGRVIGRTEYPILEPELPWEVHGVVNNVVFPCGVALRGDLLQIYYGGADYCVGVASLSMSELVFHLKTGPSACCF